MKDFLFRSTGVLLISMTLLTCIRSSSRTDEPEIFPGAYQINEYLVLLNGKRTGLVVNHSSRLASRHLVDSLISRGVNIQRIFSPEHGFKGDIPEGIEIGDEKYGEHDIPVISLYGNQRKPNASDIQQVDVMVFDLQDVGVRFYTYLSTLHYVMEACAENNVPLIVLDRPNPNGFYVDGPVMKKEYFSFIGLHPVPVVYGLTIGEYAGMINGEYWLKDSLQCKLHVVKCKGYTHISHYELPVEPSPNLKEMRAVYLYPSLAFFEGTVVSEGRGTEFPFTVAGHPHYSDQSFYFQPKQNSQTIPKFRDEICFGLDLRNLSLDTLRAAKSINLSYLLLMYHDLEMEETYFIDYFELLAGTNTLRENILEGKDEDIIRSSWKTDLEAFKKIRTKYLLYPDFE